MPILTARPIPMIASPAGSAVEIIVVTSVLIVLTAVVKAPVNASPIIVCSPFIRFMNLCEQG